jgi:hypothetical protein
MKGDYSQAGDPYGIEQEYFVIACLLVAMKAEYDLTMRYRRRYVKRIDQANQSDS